MRQASTFLAVLFSFILIYYMKKGALVKIKDEKSEKGFITGIIVYIYEGGSRISIADIYLFDTKARILAWTKDLEVLNEGWRLVI